MKKFKVILTEKQLLFIANCVEDCHRFACGETDLCNTITIMNRHKELRAKLRQLHDLAVPELHANEYYDWAGNGCQDMFQKNFIAMTYAIYREILHKLLNRGVYKYPTLTCEDNGGLPIIEEIKEE